MTLLHATGHPSRKTLTLQLHLTLRSFSPSPIRPQAGQLQSTALRTSWLVAGAFGLFRAAEEAGKLDSTRRFAKDRFRSAPLRSESWIEASTLYDDSLLLVGTIFVNIGTDTVVGFMRHFVSILPSHASRSVGVLRDGPAVARFGDLPVSYVITVDPSLDSSPDLPVCSPKVIDGS